jgi:hypothetical protein
VTPFHTVRRRRYSTYLLLINILKGLLAGIVRMIVMIVLLILQAGTMKPLYNNDKNKNNNLYNDDNA